MLDGESLSPYSVAVVEEASKNNRRRTLLVVCVGVIVGFVGFTVLGPQMVSWLYAPPVESLSCAPTVDQALTKFVRCQVASAGIGGAIAMTLLFFWRRFFRRRAEAKQSRA